MNNTQARHMRGDVTSPGIIIVAPEMRGVVCVTARFDARCYADIKTQKRSRLRLMLRARTIITYD